MSQILPFRALRYAAPPSRDISSRLSPPYDVLSTEDKRALLAADPLNFVAIDLPHTPPKEAGPEAVYQTARITLEDWRKSGVMVRDEQPAVYVYEQEYAYAGRSHLRRMFFARLRLSPFGQGDVYPHEQTFGGPKEDRLALTCATRTNLSPIFGLFPDPRNEAAELLAAHRPAEPLLRGALGGVENRLWAVTSSQASAALTRLLADRPTFIADGHHRYGTALLYREWLEREQGPLPPEHPAQYVLCVFCGMEDPGLLILPTHRVLPTLGYVDTSLRLDAEIEVHPLRADSAESAAQELARFGPMAVGLYSNASRAYNVIRPLRPELLDALEPQHSPAWRRLALAFLHAYLLDRVITPRLLEGQPPEIQYIKSAEDAVAAAVATDGSAFLLQPTTMAELAAVCAAGDLMPQKSTFFYPKLASGLVLYPLQED